MEGLHYLKFMLQQKHYLCELDLKDSYFSVPLSKESRKIIRFWWTGNLYEFLCLCFGLARVQRTLTKLLKAPTNINLKETHNKNSHISRRHASLSEGHLRSSDKDTVIYLLQHLGFLVNLGKSLLMPTKMTKSTGLIVDLIQVKLSFTSEKL